MSISVERDVGNILIKIQDDLRRLRNAISEKDKNGEKVDLSSIDSAIANTEETIREHMEQVVNVKYSNVQTLPIALSDPSPMFKLPPIQRKHSKSVHELMNLSPGESSQLTFIGKLLTQPSHPTARQLLQDTYGVHVPEASKHKERSSRKGALASGTTISPLGVLPVRNRRDATLTPPPITSKDIRKGLLNLLERGLIPKSADIVLHPPPVTNKHAQLHEVDDQKFKDRPVDAVEGGSALAGVKLDVQSCTDSTEETVVEKSQPHPNQSRIPSRAVNLTTLPHPAIDVPLHEQTSKVTVTDDELKPNILKLSIRGGKLLTNNKDYLECMKLFHENWDNVTRFLVKIEQMARDYAIPIIFVDGKKISDLAAEYELERVPGYKDLLCCVLNSREVNHMLHIPGRRYRGENGMQAAANKIQATCKMYLNRVKYLHHRRMKWAAGIIALGWALYMESSKIRKQLKESRAVYLRNYRTRLLTLKDKWDKIVTSHRVIIHLPSKGYLPETRRKTTHFSITQNFQMARICDVLDPNVSVIYVCPIEMHDDILEYYEGLLSTNTILKHGESDSTETSPWDRVYFIAPEHVKSFGNHHMSLSSILKYSNKAVKHIKRLVGDRQAFIIPHIPDRDDIELSNTLDIPLLGTEPDLVKLYSTHSGRHQFLREGGVLTPPSVREVYSYDQLVDGLAVLILSNLYVRRWIFKINHYTEGKGLAFCDVVSHLDCYGWIVKESIRYGEKWKKQWAQEYSRQRLIHELPTILAVCAQPVHKELFPSWGHYLQEFLAKGGSVEASPPSDSVTGVTVDMFIDPVGGYRLISSWDQIYSSPYQVWGGTMPQTSIEPRTLQNIVQCVAESAKTRGVLGYISVDLVTFIHPSTMEQVVWAVDIDFGPSDIACLNTLIAKLANTQTDRTDGRLVTIDGEEERYVVISTHLRHTNLALIKFSVFLQMCKAHLIAYNQKTCTGTIFTPIENHQKQFVGMICIQPTLKEALLSTAHALSAIHQEISTPQIQGQTNYPVVYQEIQSIIKQIDNVEST